VNRLPSPWPIATLTWTGCTLLLASSETPTWLRAPVVLGFLLFGPGLALSRLLDLDDATATITLACAVSITLDLVVAGGLLYAGLWNATAALLIVAAIALAASTAALALDVKRCVVEARADVKAAAR
jgi:hypothetical protein